jgi:alkylation response protein AidB-like acyl-CoA dehydrogenase
MSDVLLTAEHRRWQVLARQYAQEQIKPHALVREKIADPEERFPWDWVEDLSKLGMRTFVVPKSFGGDGADVLTCCLVGEELGAGDLGIAVAFDQTWKITALIFAIRDDGYRDAVLQTFLSDHRCLLAVGLNELTGGSDNFLPYNEPGAGVRMTAERDGRGWRLNGTKAPISNGGNAGMYFIYARTEPGTGGIEGLGCFAVPPDTPGFSVEHIYDKTAQRLVHNGLLRLDNVHASEAQYIGRRDRLSADAPLLASGRGFPEAGATVLGVARSAYEDARAFAQQRIQGGTEIINHQAISLMLAEMHIELEAARSLIWRAAVAVEQPDDDTPSLVLAAKVFASQAAFRVAGKALEVWGREAIMRSCPAEKYLRDTTSFLHSEGTNQVLSLRLANLTRLSASPRPPDAYVVQGEGQRVAGTF